MIQPLFDASCLGLIRQHHERSLGSIIQIFNGLEPREGYFEGIRTLLLHIDLSNEEIIVACELLLGTENDSLDLDLSFLLSMAEEINSAILKALLVCLHKDIHAKMLSLFAAQVVPILMSCEVDEVSWTAVRQRYPPFDLKRLRRAVFCSNNLPTSESEIKPTNEEIIAEANALNEIFSLDAIRLDHVGDWYSLVPPILEPSFEEWSFLDGLESNLPLLWAPMTDGEDQRSKAIALLTTAFSSTLSGNDLKMLLKHIEDDATIINSLTFSVSDPDKLRSLIALNWTIAVEVISRSLPPLRIELLNVFSLLGITGKSLEVLHYLIQRISVPDTIIDQFITRALEEVSKYKDDVIQPNQFMNPDHLSIQHDKLKFVKTLAVLLQELLKRCPNVANRRCVEIASFCVSFSQISECVTLYRSIKEYSNA